MQLYTMQTRPQALHPKSPDPSRAAPGQVQQAQRGQVLNMWGLGPSQTQIQSCCPRMQSMQVAPDQLQQAQVLAFRF